MKSYDYLEAYQHLLRTFKTTWSDQTYGWESIADLDDEPLVEWPNLDGKRSNPDSKTASDDEAWIRVFVKHHESDQHTFGESGCRVFTRTGMIGVDIFTPLNIGLKLPYQLAKVCKRPFEGQRGVGEGSGIIFRSVRLRERDDYKKRWAHSSVLADFEYDEVL